VPGVYYVTATSEGLSDTTTILVVGRQARFFPWKEIAALCAVVRCDRIARGAVAEFRWRNRQLAGFRVSPPMLIGLALILTSLSVVGSRRHALRLCAA